MCLVKKTKDIHMADNLLNTNSPVARVLNRGLHISPSTIVIEERSGEEGRCGRGCHLPAIGWFLKVLLKMKRKMLHSVDFLSVCRDSRYRAFYMKFHFH